MARPTEAQVRRLAKAADALLTDERRSVHYRIGFVSSSLRRLAHTADGAAVESTAEVLETGLNEPPDLEPGEEATPDI